MVFLYVATGRIAVTGVLYILDVGNPLIAPPNLLQKNFNLVPVESL